MKKGSRSSVTIFRTRGGQKSYNRKVQYVKKGEPNRTLLSCRQGNNRMEMHKSRGSAVKWVDRGQYRYIEKKYIKCKVSGVVAVEGWHQCHS